MKEVSTGWIFWAIGATAQMDVGMKSLQENANLAEDRVDLSPKMIRFLLNSVIEM